MNQGDLGLDTPREFKIKKKVKESNNQSSKDKAEHKFSINSEISKKQKYHIDNKLSLSKEIVLQVTQSELMSKVKNIISLGYKLINDKISYINKQKKYLSGSNLSYQDYQQRQKEIETSETTDILQIQEDIIMKLSQLHVKCFESIDQIIDREAIKGNLVFISEQDQQRLKSFQLSLVKKMVEDKLFNSENVVVPKTDSKVKNEDILDDQQKEETSRNRIHIIQKSKNHDNRFETQLLEKLFNHPSLSKLDQDQDVFLMTQNEKDALLNVKSDQLYNDPKFLQSLHDEYSKKIHQLIQLKNKSIKYLSEEHINEMIKLVIYALNSTHYYQKLKINQGFINPDDILYLLEQFY